MKKTIIYAASVMIITAGIFTACESKEKKVEDAQQNVSDAKQDLKDAQRELNAEYPTFKSETEVKIEDNERRIAKLREKLNQPGKGAFDEMRKNKIDRLEEKNAELRSRLYGYEKERSDWQAFKTDFKKGLDEIGDSFRELGE